MVRNQTLVTQFGLISPSIFQRGKPLKLPESMRIFAAIVTVSWTTSKSKMSL